MAKTNNKIFFCTDKTISLFYIWMRKIYLVFNNYVTIFSKIVKIKYLTKTKCNLYIFHARNSDTTHTTEF